MIAWISLDLAESNRELMRYLILLAVILCVGALLVWGILNVVRELLIRDFFHAPLLPDGQPEQAPVSNQAKSQKQSASTVSVSYTHLTLPTIYSV